VFTFDPGWGSGLTYSIKNNGNSCSKKIYPSGQNHQKIRSEGVRFVNSAKLRLTRVEEVGWLEATFHTGCPGKKVRPLIEFLVGITLKIQLKEFPALLLYTEFSKGRLLTTVNKMQLFCEQQN